MVKKELRDSKDKSSRYWTKNREQCLAASKTGMDATEGVTADVFWRTKRQTTTNQVDSGIGF